MLVIDYDEFQSDSGNSNPADATPAGALPDTPPIAHRIPRFSCIGRYEVDFRYANLLD